MEEQKKPFKIKLHPFMDEKALNAISDATLEAIGDQLVVPKLTPDDIGKNIKDEGVYLGTYEPVDRDGISLKKVFNVFAAPEDLFVEEKKPSSFFKKATTRRIETFTYVDTVKHVANLKNWHGHDGANYGIDYATDKDLYAALKDGIYNGGWIIPTCDILFGKNINNTLTTPTNIFSCKDIGSFKGTFRTAANNHYWSCSEHIYGPFHMGSIAFLDGDIKYSKINSFTFSCRPVRLVPV